MSPFNDVTVIELYCEYDMPCDALISDQRGLLMVLADYVGRAGQPVGSSELARRLLALRKRGQAKGGCLVCGGRITAGTEPSFRSRGDALRRGAFRAKDWLYAFDVAIRFCRYTFLMISV